MTDLRGSENYLEVFKKRDPRMKRFANSTEKRILFYTGDCEDGYKSFTCAKLNQMFTQLASGEFKDDRAILPRAISMMEGLQAYYHQNTPLGNYAHRAEEYPALYIDLIENLDNAALSAIGDIANLSKLDEEHIYVIEAKRFLERLAQDRANLYPVANDPNADHPDSCVG